MAKQTRKSLSKFLKALIITTSVINAVAKLIQAVKDLIELFEN